ncbi:6,7-dimethyl-8-ribityllumazine synthase, partial [Streptococcus pseudopneumoniae]|uniref:6,7-dimethyl-8-ribityllumazine synthase n=1 Tax=Streptococcus pseudopneumoniae TaxID=257758 RepID=UPI00110C234A
MPREVEGHLSAAGLDFSIVVSRFNDLITSRLLDGALDALRRHGADDDRIAVYRVPGAFEIPLLAAKLVHSQRAGDALICLGCLIRGATPHFDYIAGQTTNGI